MEVGKNLAAGINRVWWDLRTDSTPDIKLRTPPLHLPDYRMDADGTRKFPTGGQMSVLVPPGTYTVKLVGIDADRSQQFVVRKDPYSEGTEQDVAAQTKLMLQIRDDMSTTAKAINDAEFVRAQLLQAKAMLGADDAAKSVRTAIEELDAKIVEIEARLFNMTATGRGQDFLRTPSQMIEKLSHLADVVSYADFRPADSHAEMQTKLSQELARDRERLAGTVTREVSTLNELLRQRQLGAIAIPK
jgi:hypothetical protein